MAMALGMEINEVNSISVSAREGVSAVVRGWGWGWGWVCIRSRMEWRYMNPASRKHSATSWRRLRVSVVRPCGMI